MATFSTVESDLPERFHALRYLEENIYKYPDYFFPKFQEEIWQSPFSNDEKKSDILSSGMESLSSSSSGVNEIWREKICEWSYQVVDHFDFSRETVNVSLSYLDRFLTLRPVTKKLFQLAAMTSLYIAVKLYESGNLTPSSFVELSRGFFTEDHVIAMEGAILREMLLLIQKTKCGYSEYHEIVETSRFLTELGVCDYFFVTRKTSSVALACILNAFGCISDKQKRDSMYCHFSQAIRDVAGLNCGDYEVEECRARLNEIYLQGGYKRQEQGSLDRVDNTSPVCVSGTNQIQESQDRNIL